MVKGDGPVPRLRGRLLDMDVATVVRWLRTKADDLSWLCEGMDPRTAAWVLNTLADGEDGARRGPRCVERPAAEAVERRSVQGADDAPYYPAEAPYEGDRESVRRVRRERNR